MKPLTLEFETERLRLRQWSEDDRTPFHVLNSDPRVMEFFPSLLNRSKSDTLADCYQSLIAAQGWGLWAAELKETGQFIGFIGLHIPNYELPFSPCIEIGWRLAFPYWGKGLASEGARGVLHIGFDRLKLSEIVSFTSVLNLRSRAVMERLGMRQTEIFEHPHIPMDNRLRPHCLYRLSREHWINVSEQGPVPILYKKKNR